MNARRVSWVLMLAASCARPDATQGLRPLEAIDASRLCVTDGRVTRARGLPMRVDVGEMRAVAAAGTSRAAELAFAYRGPSAEQVPLANGELRRQIGLKLRAQDTCNVVYVMWHLEPDEGIFVSVKRNPGASTHQACGASGYLNLRPQTRARAPVVRDGERHVLRADLDDHVLRVEADGALVWSGALPPDAFAFDGPPGVRSDNGVFDFELRVPTGAVGKCP